MNNLTNWRVWFHGLAAAIIGGASNAIVASIVSPDTFNLSTGLVPVLKLAAVSALVAAALYLKQSPIPPSPSP